MRPPKSPAVSKDDRQFSRGAVAAWNLPVPPRAAGCGRTAARFKEDTVSPYSREDEDLMQRHALGLIRRGRPDASHARGACRSTKHLPHTEPIAGTPLKRLRRKELRCI
jgi:hypothetical protein